MAGKECAVPKRPPGRRPLRWITLDSDQGTVGLRVDMVAEHRNGSQLNPWEEAPCPSMLADTSPTFANCGDGWRTKSCKMFPKKYQPVSSIAGNRIAEWASGRNAKGGCAGPIPGIGTGCIRSVVLTFLVWLIWGAVPHWGVENVGKCRVTTPTFTSARPRRHAVA